MILLKDEEAIVAQATPQGAGAIAMIRVSGSNAIQLVDQVAALPGTKKLQDQMSHTIHYGWVQNHEKEHIDQVLFLLMKAPKTFTGQDVVEITCHNNQFLIEAIIDRLIQVGCRIAEQGEFTKRAVLHGKVDLLQAEAINDLIHAQTTVALKKSLQQLEGSFSSWIAKLERRLIMVVGLCEASFEFIDEEMSFDKQIRQQVSELQAEVLSVLSTFDKQQYVKEGVRVAFVGAANAGKSSLFNSLLNRQRAIVTSIAGTTRDSIEAGLSMQGAAVTLVDTAGLRQTTDVVEQQGVDRSFQEVALSDLILMIFDASDAYDQQDIAQYEVIWKKHKNKIIAVQNKVDNGNMLLPFLTESDVISVSATMNQNIQELRDLIASKIQELLGIGQTPCLLNKRQYNLLLQLSQHLQELHRSIQYRIDYEILAMQLKESITKLSELTGKTVSENALDAVFKDFCVGK